MPTYVGYFGIDGADIGKFGSPKNVYIGNSANFSYDNSDYGLATYTTSATITLPSDEYPTYVVIENYNSNRAIVRNSYPSSTQQVYNNTSGKYDTVYIRRPQSAIVYLGDLNLNNRYELTRILDIPDTTQNYWGSYRYWDSITHSFSINGTNLRGKSLALSFYAPSGKEVAGIVLTNRAKITITTALVGFNVTLSSATGGTAQFVDANDNPTGSTATLVAGQLIGFLITPSSGYIINSVTASAGDNPYLDHQSGNGFVYGYTMPSPASEVTITITYTYHNITWTSPSLLIEQYNNILTFTKGGSATDNLNETITYKVYRNNIELISFATNSNTATYTMSPEEEGVNYKYTLVAENSISSTGTEVYFKTVPVPESLIIYYDGSNYYTCDAKYYDGTQWNLVKPEYYDGTNWQELGPS